MRGICKMRPGRGAEYRTDLPIPQIGEDEVLMKVHASAICGTDLHIYNWNEWAANRMKNLPIVFGHETAGEIVEVGKNVTGFRVGDRISVETHIPCNHCFQCENDRRHICENMKLFGVTEPGAFAEYAPVPKDGIVRSETASPMRWEPCWRLWGPESTGWRRRRSGEKPCWSAAAVPLD